jgi:hypothetical protein
MCGNLYDPHPVLITSGEFWRCEHGTTGYGANGLWEGCAPCAEKKAHTTEIAALRDKALAYDLDQAGIERRTAEAVELVEARAEIARLLAENERLTSILYHNGFRSCDIAECNCGSWHQIGGFAARFREIEDATADEWRNGETLLTRIERIMLDLQALRGEGE